MRWIYCVSLASGKSATVPSQERIPECLVYFRARFGADAVASVTERYGDGEPVEHCPPDDRKARIVAAINEFNKRSAGR